MFYLVFLWYQSHSLIHVALFTMPVIEALFAVQAARFTLFQ
jgi:hypothetical protein